MKNKINDEMLENVSGGTLTQEQALAQALKHAGLQQADQVSKIEMDWERGTKVWEIKFFQGGMEYEYDIDAETGAIMKFEKDWD